MFFINRVIGLIIRPKTEWHKIDEDKSNSKVIFRKFLLGLITIYLVLAISLLFLFQSESTVIMNGIIKVIKHAISRLILIYVYAFLINLFSPVFGAKRNLDNAFKISSYTSIYILLQMIVKIFPFEYGYIIPFIYLAFHRYLGLVIVMKSKRLTIIYTLLPEGIIIALMQLILLSLRSLQGS